MEIGEHSLDYKPATLPVGLGIYKVDINSFHGHQSSSFIAICKDNKIICGTSAYAAAGFETCKGLRVLLFYYQAFLF